MNTKKLIAEFLGTFLFFFIGMGAVVANQFSGGAVGLLGIAAAHGLALSVMVSALGAVSGAHFNPAVTFGFMLTKRISVSVGIQYILAQLVGGILAGLLLHTIFPSELCATTHFGTPTIANGISVINAIVLEAILTFALVITVFGTAVDSRAPKIGGFGIGLIVMAEIFIGGPITGAAMNPARAFAPAIVSGMWENQFVYWVGPLLGGGLAALVYDKFMMEK